MKNEIKKEIYDRQFKLKFMGYGEWLDEPDWMEFEYKGINCLVCRVVKIEPYAKEEAYFGGHFCGYVLLPENHPLYGKNTNEINLDCWGGITHAEEAQGGWLVGFDCAHSGDIVPTSEHLRRTIPELIEIRKAFAAPKGFEKHSWFYPTYKNIAFCIKQCKSLAKQASKMMAVV